MGIIASTPQESLQTFKEFLGTDRSGADSLLALVIEAAETWVRNYTQREFNLADPENPTARSFEPSGCGTITVSDFTALESITIDGTTVDLDDVEPLGQSVTLTGEARPYTQIRYTTGARWWGQWVGSLYPISVTAAWGWSSIPGTVKMATLIAAKDIFKNRDIDFGVAAYTEYAAVRARENPQVAQMLDNYRRVEAIGIA